MTFLPSERTNPLEGPGRRLARSGLEADRPPRRKLCLEKAILPRCLSKATAPGIISNWSTSKPTARRPTAAKGNPARGIRPGRTDRAKTDRAAVSKPRPRRQTRGFLPRTGQPARCCLPRPPPRSRVSLEGLPPSRRLPVSPRNAHLAQADRAGPSRRLRVRLDNREGGASASKPFERPATVTRSLAASPGRSASRCFQRLAVSLT